MILCKKSYNKDGRVLFQYPLFNARSNSFHILCERDGKWVLVSEVKYKTSPDWVDPDWTRYGINRDKTKPNLWLVESSTGVVRASKNPLETLEINRRPTLSELREFHTYMFRALKNVKFELVQITEELFGKYFNNGAMDNNRDLTASHLYTLESEVYNLNWKLSDSAICLDVNGNVQNAKHRLTNDRNLGWTWAPVFKVTGMPVSCSTVMDCGLGRAVTGKMKIDYEIPIKREFVGAINFCLTWLWRLGDGKSRKRPVPEVENWFRYEEVAYRHMMMSTGRPLQSPVIGAFGDARTMTGDPRVMDMFDAYRDLKMEHKVGSAVWALIDAIPNLHVLTRGDKKDGNSLQQHRYKATMTAILSYLDGDKKKWDCGELALNHAFRDRDEISFELEKRKIDPSVKMGSEFVILPGEEKIIPINQAA